MNHLSQRRRGFSLFEIVVAMVILGLITSSLFSILWQAGDTAAEIRMLDRRAEEVDRFVMLLRETIEGLPPEASFTMTPASESDSGYHELKLENTPTAFVFGEMIGSAEEAFIALRPGEELPDGTQGFNLALSRSDFAPDDSDGSGMAFRVGENELLEADENGRYWLPLLTGLQGASWRFWDEDSGEWLDEWTNEDELPPLMEFSLLDVGSIPMRLVYEVPDRLVDPDAADEAAQASVEEQSSSSAIVTESSTGRASDTGQRGDGARGPRGDGGRSGGPGGQRGGGPGGPRGGGQGTGGGTAPSGGGASQGGGQ
ncbi:MAG: prepilin-type N-terminal cleavage/methylation domain-containing protein [Verrucomicrobiota bacterium]